MALDEKDDWFSPKLCQALADDYARAGGKIVVKIYPNATHGWDGNPALTGNVYLASVENYSDCMLYLEEDGTVIHEGRKYGPNDAATADAIAFLDRTIGQ